MAALPAVTLFGSTRVMSVASALGFELPAVLELAGLLLETFVSGTFVSGTAAFGAFEFGVGVFAVGVVGSGSSAGIAVAGVPLLEAELAGFAVVFVALKLGVPRKSRDTKPPTTSKIRVIIKVSTQFRRHQPIGFMTLLYPLSV